MGNGGWHQKGKEKGKGKGAWGKGKGSGFQGVLCNIDGDPSSSNWEPGWSWGENPYPNGGMFFGCLLGPGEDDSDEDEDLDEGYEDVQLLEPNEEDQKLRVSGEEDLEEKDQKNSCATFEDMIIAHISKTAEKGPQNRQVEVKVAALFSQPKAERSSPINAHSEDDRKMDSESKARKGSMVLFDEVEPMSELIRSELEIPDVNELANFDDRAYASVHEPVDDNCIDSCLSNILTIPDSLALTCIEASIFPQGFEELEETMGIQKEFEHLFPALTVADYEDLHAPMPSFEDRIPMPDFLYPGMPNLEFDYSEDAVPEEKVPLPFSDLIDLFIPLVLQALPPLTQRASRLQMGPLEFAYQH